MDPAIHFDGLGSVAVGDDRVHLLAGDVATADESVDAVGLGSVEELPIRDL